LAEIEGVACMREAAGPGDNVEYAKLIPVHR